MTGLDFSRAHLENVRKLSFWQWKVKLYKDYIRHKMLEEDFKTWYTANKMRIPRE